MKVTELLENEEKKTFTVVFKLGRHSRTQQFTHKTIAKNKALSQAEIRTILKLPVGGTLNTQFASEDGRTIVTVTRTK